MLCPVMDLLPYLRWECQVDMIERHLGTYFPGANGKEPACQCRRHKRHGFDPWARKVPWRKAWQPTPVFLPGESRGQKSLAGYSRRGRKESDMTEATSHVLVTEWIRIQLPAQGPWV